MSSTGEDEAGAAVGIKIIWKPTASNFRAYNAAQSERRNRHGGLQIVVSPSIPTKLTKFIVAIYHQCNPSFSYSETFNPKRYLTNPSAGLSNNGLDNKNSDLILAVNGILVNGDSNHRYVVKEMLGQGTFGQVVKCWSDNSGSFVAVKVIKNQAAYYQQATVEIEILRMLNQQFDPDDRHHIVRVLDWFIHEKHLCIVFELLSHNLYELLKFNAHKGISLQLLRTFTKQMLDSLVVLKDAGVIHCDLKPENILLSSTRGDIKLIDFGSACRETRTVYSYIQSRFYRSPEVVLGHPYSTAIDMWSLGCVAAELFLGLPLFAGDSEYDLLRRMIDTLGFQPPDRLLRRSSNTSKYFKNVSAAPPSYDGTGAYQFLTPSEFKARENKEPLVGKRYFKHTKLEDIISKWPYKRALSKDEIEAERQRRLVFLDFLRGLVRFDPEARWTPNQASQHPFITEEPFTGCFEPPQEMPRTPVGHGMTVEHNPGAGHWFGAGLSPQVSHINVAQQYGSPLYHGGPFSYTSSCGSYGSCDGFGLGSYEATNMYYPTPPGGPQLQSDWRRMYPTMPSYGPLGISPSSNVFKPVSLGGSPSQFTPPGSQFPSPSSSHTSPRYGPPSPRYGKVLGPHKPRRGFCPPMTQSTGFSLPYDGARQYLPQPNGGFEASNNSQSEVGTSGSHSRSYGQSHLRPSRGPSAKSANYRAGSLEAYLSETLPEPPSECSASHADWFPNDSNDLLDEENHKQQLPSGSGGARLGPGQGGASSVGGPGYMELAYTRLNDSHHFSQSSSILYGYGSYDEMQPSGMQQRLPDHIAFSSPQHTSGVLSRQYQRSQAPRSVYQQGYLGYQYPPSAHDQHLAGVAR